MKNILLLVTFTLLASCGESDTEMRGGAQFRTMAACLEGIKESSGQSLEIITDKPDNVSGYLSNRQHFGCLREHTGTKGIYYEGFYFVKKHE